MKILHVAPYYKPAYIYGGPTESIPKLCESLVAAGHLVTVYTTNANGEADLNVRSNIPVNVDGVTVTYFKRVTKGATWVSPALWKKLSATANEYDVIHIHTWWNPLAIIACWICVHKKAKIVLSPRGMLTPYIFNSTKSGLKSLIHKLTRNSLLLKTTFHATSSSEFDECRALLPRWPGFIAPNILSLPDTPQLIKANDMFTMIYMSRIHAKKGIELLFRALSKIEFPFQLRIAGTGDEAYIAQLKAFANELRIGDKINWLGWKNRSEKYTELSEADIFVLTSSNENFANVVIETLYMGTPVIISRDVALSSLILEHDLGWVTTLEPENIEANIRAAYADLRKRKQIEGTARSLINNVFEETKLVQTYIDGYKKLLKQP